MGHPQTRLTLCRSYWKNPSMNRLVTVTKLFLSF